MSKRLVACLLLAAAAAATIFIFWPSDERRIKKLFKEGAAAVESRDLDGVMSKISYTYRDNYGMTYMYLKETLKREFAKLSDPHVELSNLRIKVFKKTVPKEEGGFAVKQAIAEADVRVLATVGTETGYVIGDPKSPLHLRFTLEKERMSWHIVEAEGYLPDT
jgi:hypothetical protein